LPICPGLKGTIANDRFEVPFDSPKQRYLRNPKAAARTAATVGRAWHHPPGEGRRGRIPEVIAAIHSEWESCTSFMGAVTIKFGANCFLPFWGRVAGDLACFCSFVGSRFQRCFAGCDKSCGTIITRIPARQGRRRSQRAPGEVKSVVRNCRLHP
jgi:hypothetical protein